MLLFVFVGKSLVRNSNRNDETLMFLFLCQIKTKHRYMWTKREFTEEGSLLGELVDQVSPPSVQISGSSVV